jgi:ribosomal protein L11 methyltransferase
MKINNNMALKAAFEAVVHHDPELTEAVSYFFFENGALAVINEESPVGEVTRAGFGSIKPSEELIQKAELFLSGLAEFFDLAAAPTVMWEEVPYGNWAEEWKKGLGPIEIDSRLVVKPTWIDYEAKPGQVVLNLDPGMAFGTGAHATTFLCLGEIVRYYEGADRGESKVLDIGTGSGVLAMACAALGQGPIMAIDIDAEVMPVAEENLALNHLESQVMLELGDPKDIEGEFDLVLANILADELIRMASCISRLCAPGAWLVLSGILDYQADPVIEAYKSFGLELIDVPAKEEWVAITMRSRA